METFATWFEELRGARRLWTEANRHPRNRFDRGIWNATVEKYADPSHFVFELLQNAEDAGASHAVFRITPAAILFEHDGKPFDRGDIEGITGLGNTTKPEEANKIGCFGIGFKSVYVITDRPEVHCTIEGKPIAFAILDLVLPELIDTTHDSSDTLIILPLRPATADATLARVRTTLPEAAPRSLLYLRQLRMLEWIDGQTGGRCVAEDSEAGIRTLRTTIAGQRDRSDRFLVRARPVRRDDSSSEHAVKIALRLNDAGQVVPEPTPTRLSVFFETEEPTGLHFHVHGPFQLTDNRANIKQDNDWNLRLIDELAGLLSETLFDLRDQGRVSRTLLEALPNANDDLPTPWERLRAAVLNAFREHQLLPAFFGGYIRASSAVRGPTQIREFLRDEGLVSFAGLAEKRWAIGALGGSRAEAFLSSLEIAEWGGADLVAAFRRAFTPTLFHNPEAEIAAGACDWFDALDDESLQRLYLLVEAAMRTERRSLSLSQMAFVRLENGRRVRPNEALLPPTGTPPEEEPATQDLALVRLALIRSGRRGKDVEQFLRRAGVRDISERDYLSAIIRANYADDAPAPTVERHMQHMRRFLRWHAEHSQSAVFNDVAFLRVEGATGYHKPDAIYLDEPYLATGLSLIYDGSTRGRRRRPLWSGYARLKRDHLVALAKAAGVEDRLLIEQTYIPYDHPHSNDLRRGFGPARHTDSGHDVDYTIPQLPALLARAHPEISKQIWRAVAAAGGHVMQASFAPNQAHEPHRAPSTLALRLAEAAWIPAKDGSLRRPSAITGPELAAGLSTRGNEAWLHAIGFAAEHRRRSEEHQTRRRAAQTIGLPEELADQLATLSPEALRAFGTEMLRRVANGAFGTAEFPEREAPNPARRAARLAERARTAAQKTYEVRNRSVRTSNHEARQMARPYLAGLYTNPAGEMICQACHQPMPFRLADGSPYFEAPEFVLQAPAELPENHLALCPVCSAKWQHVKATTDEAILEALQAAEALQITVNLAGEDVLIRFVRVHLDDLRTIMAVMFEGESAGASAVA